MAVKLSLCVCDMDNFLRPLSHLKVSLKVTFRSRPLLETLQCEWSTFERFITSEIDFRKIEQVLICLSNFLKQTLWGHMQCARRGSRVTCDFQNKLSTVKGP